MCIRDSCDAAPERAPRGPCYPTKPAPRRRPVRLRSEQGPPSPGRGRLRGRDEPARHVPPPGARPRRREAGAGWDRRPVRCARLTTARTGARRWDVPSRLVATAETAATWAGRTLLGPEPNRPSAGSRLGGITRSARGAFGGCVTVSL